jgi:hypothetical protein
MPPAHLAAVPLALAACSHPLITHLLIKQLIIISLGFTAPLCIEVHQLVIVVTCLISCGREEKKHSTAQHDVAQHSMVRKQVAKLHSKLGAMLGVGVDDELNLHNA